MLLLDGYHGPNLQKTFISKVALHHFFEFLAVNICLLLRLSSLITEEIISPFSVDFSFVIDKE